MFETRPNTISISFSSWVRAVVVIALAYAFFRVRHVVLVILTAIVIASAVEPAAQWAKKRNIPRLPTVIAVYVMTALLLAGLFYFLLMPVLNETSSFLQTLPEAQTSAQSFAATERGGSIFSGISDSLSLDQVSGYISTMASRFSQGVFSSVSLIFGGVTSLILIVVLSFYLAVQEDGIGKFLRVITPIRQERYVIGLWKRSETKIGLWMQGQLLLGAIVMVLSYLGLLLVGVPHALLLAVLSGVFEIIPIFGPILSAIPAIFVGFSSGGTSTALVVAGLFLIIQQFENHLIYPLVVKKVVGVPPMVSIIALLIGGQLAGFLGVLIAVPLATVFMEFLSDLERHKAEQIEQAATPTS